MLDEYDLFPPLLGNCMIWMKQAEALAQLGRAGLKVNAQTID